MWGALFGGQVRSERCQILSKPNSKAIHWMISLSGERSQVLQVCSMQDDELGQMAPTQDTAEMYDTGILCSAFHHLDPRPTSGKGSRGFSVACM
jgi:hypothetical protein